MNIYENSDIQYDQQIETRSLLDQASPASAAFYRALGNEVVGPYVATIDLLGRTIRSIGGWALDGAVESLEKIVGKAK